MYSKVKSLSKDNVLWSVISKQASLGRHWFVLIMSSKVIWQ